MGVPALSLVSAVILIFDQESTHLSCKDFFKKLVSFTCHPAASPCFKPVQSLLDFCNSNNIQI